MKKQGLIKLTYSALCLCLMLILPFLTGQIPSIGNMLCPLHFPALLCGFLCGWPYGLAVGFTGPLLRSVLFSMPPLYPKAIVYAFECAAYGMTCGIFYRLLPKKPLYTYTTLGISMVCGRAVYGIVYYILLSFRHTKFGFSAFLSGAVTEAIPGIIAQFILIPPAVFVLKKAGLIPDRKI